MSKNVALTEEQFYLTQIAMRAIFHHQQFKKPLYYNLHISTPQSRTVDSLFTSDSMRIENAVKKIQPPNFKINKHLSCFK
jgi:hypothetical protein